MGKEIKWILGLGALALGLIILTKRASAIPIPTIIVNSTPTGADIYLDNNYFGKTNSSYEITAGTHTLKLTLPGYYDYTETFSISQGEAKTFNITLTAPTGNNWCNGADTNKDGIVDTYDYVNVKMNYGRMDCNGSNDWCDGADTNKDGTVDWDDLSTVMSEFGRSDCSGD